MSIKVENDYKCYKVKSYNNSEGDPFGVTLNGKTKDYIESHNKFREKIKKGSNYTVECRDPVSLINQKTKITFLNVVITKTVIDAIVEVTSQDGTRGNAQLKSYNPSQNKRKGATTELRKLSDYDYSQVELLKAIVTSIFDRLINGDTLNNIFEDYKTDFDPKFVSSTEGLSFSCDLCNYKTKYKPGLKMHKTKMHLKNPNKCNDCDFVSFFKAELKEHLVSKHPLKEQTKKRSQVFDITEESEKSSPSLSPDKKKVFIDCDVDTHSTDVEMTEVKSITQAK